MFRDVWLCREGVRFAANQINSIMHIIGIAADSQEIGADHPSFRYV